MAKKEFTEGPIYVAMTYFSWFVISNIYFLLLNILLIFFLLAIEVDLSNPTYYLMFLWQHYQWLHPLQPYFLLWVNW